MAGSFADFAENTVLDELFGGTNYAPPATLYVALFTARGTDNQSDAGTNFVEVTGGSYVRKSVTNNLTNFPAAVSGAKSNGVAITFASATADWGTVIACGIYDAVTAGNLLAWSDFTQSKVISNTDQAIISIGAMAITLS